jgi:hypothetical protein
MVLYAMDVVVRERQQRLVEEADRYRRASHARGRGQGRGRGPRRASARLAIARLLVAAGRRLEGRSAYSPCSSVPVAAASGVRL